MIDILKEILPLAMEKTIKQAPKIKSIWVEKDISDVNPKDLISWMEKNKIPDDAEFDSFEDCAHLSWIEKVPTTNEEQHKYVVRRFDQVVWALLYERLTKIGYTRTGCCSSIFKKYPSVHEMYMDKDFERIEEFYLHRFKKES